MGMSGNVKASTLRTNLVLYHRVADILGQAADLSHILCIVQEPCDLASPFQ